MFNTIVINNPTLTTQDLLLLHPEQLMNLIEGVWIEATRGTTPPYYLITDGQRPSLHSMLKYDPVDLLGYPKTVGPAHPVAVAYEGGLVLSSTTWPHLIYGYMLENTRMVQIFQRVLQAYTQGEDLGTPSPHTAAWLRNTEMLFYRHLPGYHTMNIRSEIRPDSEATRRNAYYRMFGMDLAHGTQENKAYPFTKPHHSNRDFVTIFERLLHEVHQAIMNLRNSSGVNTTDFASITDLFKNIQNMLRLRRQGGNLAREEFNATVMMSWFHFTLKQQDFSLISDLSATAYSPEDRLIKIGKKVGLPASVRSGSFFELADLLSYLFLQIEEGRFDDIIKVKLAFGPPTGIATIIDPMTKIITQWSIATGRNIKAKPVRPTLIGA